MARPRKNADEAASADGGVNALMQNKAAIAIILILIVAAYLTLQGGAPVGQGATTTTAPPNIKSSNEAGKTISDLSSSAVDAGAVLRDIDNSIG